MLRDRFEGCLVGLAIGDALGAPLEFMDASAIQSTHGQVRDMLGGGWLNLQPGEWTDDTEMALAIAESIVEKGRFSPDDVADRFVTWYRSQPKDVGNTTKAVLSLMDQGIRWTEAARQAHNATAAGNGSLMRCAPVAMRYCKDLDSLFQHSLTSSCITHVHAEARWACVAANAIIGSLLDEKSWEKAHTVAVDLCADATSSIKTLIGDTSIWQSPPDDPSGYVMHTLHAALWANHTTTSFEEAVIAAVNLGGDADSIGAVTGAIAGARYGLASIPQRWRLVLRQQDHLIALSRQLKALAGIS